MAVSQALTGFDVESLLDNSQNWLTEAQLCNRNLWLLVSEQSQAIIDQKQELNAYKARLLLGVKYINISSVNAKSINYKKENKDLQALVKTVSSLLSCSERNSLILTLSYILNAYDGKRSNIKAILEDETKRDEFAVNVMQYYMDERLYILRALKCIMISATRKGGNNSEVQFYRNFCLELKAGNVEKQLVEQFSFLSKADVPTLEANGKLMIKEWSSKWALQYINELNVLLDVMAYHFDAECPSDVTVKQFIDALKVTKFGTHLPYRFFIDYNNDACFRQDKICYASGLILLRMLGIRCLREYCDGTISRLVGPLGDVNMSKELENMFQELGNQIPVCPIILAWVTKCCVDDNDPTPQNTIELYNKRAQKADVFGFLGNIVKSDWFIEDFVWKSIVYDLVSSSAMVFNNDTFGDTETIIRLLICCITDKISWSLYKPVYPNRIFPFDHELFFDMLSKIAKTSGNNANEVYAILEHATTYAEVLSDTRSGQIQCISDDGTIWKLLEDKFIYPQAIEHPFNFKISKGTIGKTMLQGEPAISWTVEYSTWKLFILEIDICLSQLQDPSIAISKLPIIDYVKKIIKLVRSILDSNWELIGALSSFISRAYIFLERCHYFKPWPASDLITECISCIVTTIKHEPLQAFEDLIHTRFLPYSTSDIYNDPFSLDGGSIGSIILAYEKRARYYSMTLNFLTLVRDSLLSIHDQYKTLGNSNLKDHTFNFQTDLLATINFVVIHIFTDLHRWNFSDPREQEQIVKLVNILSAGTSMVRSYQPSERNVMPVQILKSTLKIILRLYELISIPKSSNLTREGSNEKEMDTCIFPGAEHDRLLLSTSSYLFCRWNPRLLTIALNLFKNLCLNVPMSIYANLGHDAETLRDLLISHLRMKDTDLKVKEAILEVLIVIMQTQPGLVVLLMNLEVPEENETIKSNGIRCVRFNDMSCLSFVTQLLRDHSETSQSSGSSEPSASYQLLCSSVELLYYVWKDHRVLALDSLRAVPNFWKYLAALLKKLPTQSNEEIGCHIKASAYTLQIMAIELSLLPSSKLSGMDTSIRSIFVDAFKKSTELIAGNLLTNTTIECEGELELTLNDFEVDKASQLQTLLKCWRTFTIIISKVDGIEINDSAKLDTLNKIIECLDYQLTRESSSSYLSIVYELSCLLDILINLWSSHLGKSTELFIEKLASVLLHAIKADVSLPDVIKPQIFTALIKLFQAVRNSKNSQLRDVTFLDLTNIVCETIQRHNFPPFYKNEEKAMISEIVKDHIKNTRSNLQILTSKEFKESVDKAKTKKSKLPITSTYLLCEIIQLHQNLEVLLPTLIEYNVVQTLLKFMEISFQRDDGAELIEAALCLFIQMTKKTPTAAESLVLNGVSKYLCLDFPQNYTLPIIDSWSSKKDASVYASETKVKKKPNNKSEWRRTWRLGISLMSILLGISRHSFLADAFNFVGVHYERMEKVLASVRYNQSLECLEEAEEIMNFLFQLAHFENKWQFDLPIVFNRMQISIMSLCRSCTILLSRSQLLHHMVKHSSPEKKPGTSIHHIPISTNLKTVSFSKEPDEDQISPEIRPLFEKVQICLVNILCKGLSALRQFSPDLTYLVTENNIEQLDRKPMLLLSYNAPAAEDDGPVSFGAMLACQTMALTLLNKLEYHRSTLLKSPTNQNLNSSVSVDVSHKSKLRSALLYILENCQVLILSQALLYLCHSDVSHNDKQMLRWELSTELGNFLNGVSRYFTRGGSHSSPRHPDVSMSSSNNNLSLSFSTTPNKDDSVNNSKTWMTNSSGQSPRKLAVRFADSSDQKFFHVMDTMVHRMLNRNNSTN
ncbi:Nucleoporin NUP188-like protein [Trichoplax sp. H2]|nr:Nucleoporin NUP188-like protein [Trichoplax sp. H2]|eukprot:RDD44036.1 Nucleoporin NUP188-like protein [Trichoplax sp. H2]